MEDMGKEKKRGQFPLEENGEPGVISTSLPQDSPDLGVSGPSSPSSAAMPVPDSGAASAQLPSSPSLSVEPPNSVASFGKNCAPS